MKTVIIFFVLLISIHRACSEDVLLRAHAQEIAIVSPSLAKKIFYQLDVEEKEADLVASLFFKNDEFLFCHKEPDRVHMCSIYLNFAGIGELSSYFVDSDYGKGNLYEAISEKPVYGRGDITFYPTEIKISVSKAIARMLYSKMDQIYEDVLEDDYNTIYQRDGVDIQCVEIYSKQKKQTDYSCTINIKINGDWKDSEKTDHLF